MIKKDLKNIINFFKYIKPYWKKEILVWFLNFSIATLSLVNPYLSKLVIDQAYAHKDLGLFIKLLIFGGLIFIITNLFGSLSQYLNQYIYTKINLKLQRDIFQKIESLSYGFFQEKSPGEFIYKLITDSERAVSFLTDNIPDVFHFILQFLFVLAILLRLNWKMTIFLFVIALFLHIPNFLFIRGIRKRTEKIFESAQDILEVAREAFSNMQLVKIFGKEKSESKRYIRQLIDSMRINISAAKLNWLSSFLDNGRNKLLFGLMTFYGGYHIIKGQMTLGSFAAIILYINQLLGLQSGIASLFMRFTAESISLQRLAAILELWPKEAEDKNADEFLFSSGEIEFQEVSFGYCPERPVLSQLNFNIRSGAMVGLVGRSGCGKTTITNLIVKLYPISNGRIFIDRQDSSLIKNRSLRSQIGVTLQKPILWNDTIRNNILYGFPHANSQELLRSAEISCSYDFIKNLPNGFDTAVGEGGMRISEGQKQRIAIARAVIKNPKILIIDEGMSSLDSQTEDKIIDNLKSELKDATIIVVSHRLSTIKKMDLVYFLESVNKINIGSHEHLVKDNPKYRDLFASQIEDKESAPSYSNKDTTGE